MPLIAQRVPTLLGGVSQQPPALRDAQQLEEQINGLSHASLGLLKRPPTAHIAKLSSTVTGAENGFVLPIEAGGNRYVALLYNGTITVYDRLTGASQTVDSPDGLTYLNTTGPYRAVQIGGSTVIVNTSKVVAKATTQSPDKAYGALIVVRQADYSTQYSVTLNSYKVSVGSPEGVTPQARAEIDTTNMAARLKSLINGSDLLSAFTVTQYGSTLHIVRTDGADFTISTDDGLADNGLLVVKGSIQRFTDLPVKAPAGFIVEITGDPSTAFDNYFVKFDVTDTATNAGVWRECVKPGETIALDASTLPHALTYKGSYLDATSQGAPPTPRLSTGGGSEVSDLWTLGGGILVGVLQLHNDNDQQDCTVTQANSIETVYTVKYKVDSRKADATNPAELVLYKVVGGVPTELTRVLIGTEVYLDNQTISGLATLGPTDKIRAKLEYTQNTTPADGKRVDVYLKLPGVTFVKRTGKTVIFEPARVYPQGTLYRVTVDAINFDTTPGSDQTGAQLAITLKGLIDAHASYTATNPESGTILIVKDAGGVATVTDSVGFTDTTTFHSPTAAMTASALIGKTIKNLTDGSSGTISANATTTITTVLSGGADNSFKPGDKVTVVGSGNYFVFRRPTWAQRVAGDVTTNPMPSIVDRSIDEVFFHKGRLGFAAQEAVVLSEVSQSFNLFRTTVTQLLDSDLIDVKPANAKSVRFHSATEWNGVLLLWSGRHQYALTGTPILTPTTVELKLLTEYPSATVRPVVLGRRVYYTVKRNTFTQAYSYEEVDNQNLPAAINISLAIPKYLVGAPLVTAGDDEAGFFGVMTDANRRVLFVNSYSRDLGMNSWSQWQFPPGSTLMGFDVFEGLMALVFKRADGIYLETLDLGVR
jgi:hypothetical protein